MSFKGLHHTFANSMESRYAGVHLINTDKGPMVRFWVPRAGWFHAVWNEEERSYSAGTPADCTVFTSYIKAL